MGRWHGLFAHFIERPGKAVAVMPSPTGRRCRAAAVEGRVVGAWTCRFPLIRPPATFSLREKVKAKMRIRFYDYGMDRQKSLAQGLLGGTK